MAIGDEAAGDELLVDPETGALDPDGAGDAAPRRPGRRARAAAEPAPARPPGQVPQVVAPRTGEGRGLRRRAGTR
ncbi:MAG: hypothetical protein R2716_03060 [Microthrixaceae bacterium]